MSISKEYLLSCLSDFVESLPEDQLEFTYNSFIEAGKQQNLENFEKLTEESVRHELSIYFHGLTLSQICFMLYPTFERREHLLLQVAKKNQRAFQLSQSEFANSAKSSCRHLLASVYFSQCIFQRGQLIPVKDAVQYQAPGYTNELIDALYDFYQENPENRATLETLSLVNTFPKIVNDCERVFGTSSPQLLSFLLNPKRVRLPEVMDLVSSFPEWSTKFNFFRKSLKNFDDLSNIHELAIGYHHYESVLLFRALKRVHRTQLSLKLATVQENQILRTIRKRHGKKVADLVENFHNDPTSTLQSIGDIAGVTRESVRIWIKKLGAPAASKKRRPRKVQTTQLAEALPEVFSEFFQKNAIAYLPLSWKRILVGDTVYGVASIKQRNATETYLLGRHKLSNCDVFLFVDSVTHQLYKIDPNGEFAIDLNRSLGKTLQLSVSKLQEYKLTFEELLSEFSCISSQERFESLQKNAVRQQFSRFTIEIPRFGIIAEVQGTKDVIERVDELPSTINPSFVEKEYDWMSQPVSSQLSVLRKYLITEDYFTDTKVRRKLLCKYGEALINACHRIVSCAWVKKADVCRILSVSRTALDQCLKDLYGKSSLKKLRERTDLESLTEELERLPKNIIGVELFEARTSIQWISIQRNLQLLQKAV